VSRTLNLGRPPDERGGGPTPETASHHNQPTTTRHHPSGISYRSGYQRAIGRYASGWRDGFTAGAIDALRQAGRQLPPESWHLVEALANAYELAGGGDE
jgi:hypothetical protein